MWKKIIGYLGLFLLVSLSLTLISSDKLKNTAIKDTTARFTIGHFTIDDIDRNTKEKKSFEIQDVTVPSVTDVMLDLGSVDRNDVIGGILIPDVDINLPVFWGVTREHLTVGAGTLKEDQLPGQGNYGLAAHHMKDQSLLFGPLSQIEEGNTIYLTDLESVYIYEVSNIEVIHETETEVLDDTKEPLITLITCNISGINTDNRLMVQGKLIEEIPADDIEGNDFAADYLQYLELSNKQKGYHTIFWLLGIVLASSVITLGAKYVINK